MQIYDRPFLLVHGHVLLLGYYYSRVSASKQCQAAGGSPLEYATVRINCQMYHPAYVRNVRTVPTMTPVPAPTIALPSAFQIVVPPPLAGRIRDRRRTNGVYVQ
jgi:hypothetical protein